MASHRGSLCRSRTPFVGRLRSRHLPLPLARLPQHRGDVIEPRSVIHRRSPCRTKRSEDGRRHQPSDAAEAIAEAHRRLTTGPIEWLAAHGFADVTPAMVAMAISIEPDGLGLVGLRERTGTTKRAVSQVVALLCGRGYATMAADEHDARHRTVNLTDRGVALRLAAFEARMVVGHAISEALADGRADRLVQMLHELTDAVSWITASRAE